MFYIGCHLSASKGFYHMGQTALEIGANTFQFFTRNPRGGSAKAIDEEDVRKFSELTGGGKIGKIVAHAPYTLNLCSADESIRTFAKNTMADDLRRMEYVPNNYYNFHPGSHVKQGADVGIKLITDALNEVLTPDIKTTVLLETMAGKGSEVGRSFEEIRAIIDGVELSDKLGVCLDTCHVHDGGYDIVDDLNGVVEEFDRVVGLDRLKAIHLNDSKNARGAHKDRHETIGNGFIGLDAFERIINHPSLAGMPFELETPNELDGYAREIALLKDMYKGD